MPRWLKRKDGGTYILARVDQSAVATFQVSGSGEDALRRSGYSPGDRISRETFFEGYRRQWFTTGGSGVSALDPRPPTVIADISASALSTEEVNPLSDMDDVAEGPPLQEAYREIVSMSLGRLSAEVDELRRAALKVDHHSNEETDDLFMRIWRLSENARSEIADLMALLAPEEPAPADNGD